MSSCATCESLSQAGVTTDEKQVCPPAAEQLEQLDREGLLRRCRRCGTLYRYRHHYEYDVYESWDEYYLWRLGDVAQKFIGGLLKMPTGKRDDQYMAGLRHQDRATCDAVALVLKTFVETGEVVGESVIAVAVQTLGRGGWVMQYGYRTLLAYIKRGAAEKQLAQKALQSVKLDGTAEQYRNTLLREARK